MDISWINSNQKAQTYANYKRIKENKELDAEYKRLSICYPFLSTDQLRSKAKRNIAKQIKAAKIHQKSASALKASEYDWKDEDEDFTTTKKSKKTNTNIAVTYSKFEMHDDASSLDPEDETTVKGKCFYMDLDVEDKPAKRRRQYNPLTIRKNNTIDRNKVNLTTLQKHKTEKVTFIVKKPVIIEVIELSSDDDEWQTAPMIRPKIQPIEDYRQVKIKQENISDDENSADPSKIYPRFSNVLQESQKINECRRQIRTITSDDKFKAKNIQTGISGKRLSSSKAPEFESKFKMKQKTEKYRMSQRTKYQPKVENIKQPKTPKEATKVNSGGALCELFD